MKGSFNRLSSRAVQPWSFLAMRPHLVIPFAFLPGITESWQILSSHLWQVWRWFRTRDPDQTTWPKCTKCRWKSVKIAISRLMTSLLEKGIWSFEMAKTIYQMQETQYSPVVNNYLPWHWMFSAPLYQKGILSPFTWKILIHAKILTRTSSQPVLSFHVNAEQNTIIL